MFKVELVDKNRRDAKLETNSSRRFSYDLRQQNPTA
jgi:hypothetical protein